MNNFNGNIEKLVINAPKHEQALENMFRLTSLQQGFQTLQGFAAKMKEFLNEGVEDSMDKGAAMTTLVQGMLINNPQLNEQLRKAGPEAMKTFSQSIQAQANKEAIRIGLNTTFSDNQVAQGMAILVKSGIPLEDVLDGVADSMAKVAMIGGVDIPTAAKHMVSLFNQFGPQLKETFGGNTTAAMEHVADVITNALSASGSDLNQFMTALSYSGTISALAGQSFENTATVLALFAKNGIYGSKSGTGLRRIITNLTPSTEKAEEAIRRLTATIGGNADIFYDASGKMKPLTEVQALLYEQMKDKSPQEQIFLMKEIFGQYAVGQALVLATSNEFGNLAEKMHQTGTAQQFVDAVMDSSKGKMDRFTEAVNTLKETWGAVALESLDPFRTKMADLIEKFLNLPEPMQKAIALTVLITTALTGLVATLGIVITTLAILSLTLGVSMLALAGIAAAIVAVIAIGAFLYTHWDQVKEKAKQVWEAVKQAVGNFVSAVIDWFKELPGKIVGFVVGVGTWLSENIAKSWNAIVTWTSDTWQAIKDWFYELPGKISYWIGFVAGYLSEAIPKAWTAFTTWLSDTVKAMIKWFEELPSKVVSAITNVGTWLSENISKAWNFAKTWLPVVWDFILEWTIGLPAKLIALIREYAPKLLEAGLKIGEAILDGIKSALLSIGEFISGLVRGAIDAGKRAWEGFKAGFGDGKAKATIDIDGNTGETIKHAAGGIFTGPTRIGRHLFGEAGPEALIPLNTQTLERYGLGAAASGQRQQTVNIIVHYNGSGSKQELDYLAAQIRREVPV